ncbi:MAG: arsenate reductase (glutaredoxin) [Saprospiraceae bacterium]|nr:arsenate reductase (glutaredoxin) [Saprospiraceae bacterium]
MKFKIYHNPRCGKSRDALKYLHQKEIETEIILYLQNTPTFEELKDVICKLKLKPIDLIRKQEKVFTESFSNLNLSDEDWIHAMVANPILIERPVIISDNEAVIGRPKERIEELLHKNKE